MSSNLKSVEVIAPLITKINSYNQKETIALKIAKKGLLKLSYQISTLSGKKPVNMEGPLPIDKINWCGIDSKSQMDVFICHSKEKIHVFHGNVNSGFFLQKM